MDAVFRRLAGGEPVVAAYQRLVPPDRREHVGSQLHGGAQLLGDAVNFRHIRHVVRRHGHVQLYPHAQLPQGPDILRDPGKHGTAAQPLIGGIAGPVEGDVEAERRLVPEKVQPVPVDKGPVAIHRHQQPHFLQLRQQIAEILADQRLAAGQQQEQHAPAAGLLGDGQPFVGSKLPAPALLLLRRQVDVAHFTVEVAPGRQLKIPGQGRSGPTGPGVQVR